MFYPEKHVQASVSSTKPPHVTSAIVKDCGTFQAWRGREDENVLPSRLPEKLKLEEILLPTSPVKPSQPLDLIGLLSRAGATPPILFGPTDC